MKSCPRCNRFYPDSAWTCPKDGYQLATMPVAELAEPPPTFAQDVFGKSRHASRRLALHFAPLRRCGCGESMRAFSLIERRQGRFNLKTGSCLNYRCQFCAGEVAIESRFSIASMVFDLFFTTFLGLFFVAAALIGLVPNLIQDSKVGRWVYLLILALAILCLFGVKPIWVKLKTAVVSRKNYPEVK